MNEENSLSSRISRLEVKAESLKREIELVKQELSESKKDISLDIDSVPEDIPATEILPPKTDPPISKKTESNGAEDSAKRVDGKLMGDYEWDSEYWISKIGIGLLLFGVAFLFKYSIDQGWITPLIRVVTGLIISFILLEAGVRTHIEKRHLSQVFLGGGSAALYITVFASYQIYQLIGYPSAFFAMLLVTILTFYLSIRQNEPMLACIAAIGGLATPFILITESSSIPNLIVYVCLITLGSSVIFIFKGWRSLLWLCYIAVWPIFYIVIRSLPYSLLEGITDRWFIQSGLIAGLVAFWAIPVIREVLFSLNPDRWVRPPISFLSNNDLVYVNRYAHYMSFSTPLIFSYLTRETWLLESALLGWVFFTLALIFAVSTWKLRKFKNCEDYAYTHAFAATMLVAIASTLYFSGNAEIITLAAEGCALAYIAKRLSSGGFTLQSHVVFFVTFLLIMDSLIGRRVGELAIINVHALTDLTALTLTLIASYTFKNQYVKDAYRIILVALLMGWFGRELTPIQHGYDYLIIVWTAVALLSQVINVRFSYRMFGNVCHFMFFIIGLWVWTRILNPQVGGYLFLNHQALADLTIIVTALLLATKMPGKRVRMTYLILPYIALLGLFSRELSVLSNGQGYTSASWAIFAIALLVYGLRVNNKTALNIALGTILLVVGKLFLFDLSHVDTIWRIFLFLGFGSALLIISYYYGRLQSNRT